MHSFTIVGLCKGNYLKEEGEEGGVGMEVSKLEQSSTATSQKKELFSLFCFHMASAMQRGHSLRQVRAK